LDTELYEDPYAMRPQRFLEEPPGTLRTRTEAAIKGEPVALGV
jgi:hypothetical protein